MPIQFCARCKTVPVKETKMCVRCAASVAAKSRRAVGGHGFFPIRKANKK